MSWPQRGQGRCSPTLESGISKGWLQWGQRRFGMRDPVVWAFPDTAEVFKPPARLSRTIPGFPGQLALATHPPTHSLLVRVPGQWLL